jgi:hypothetical protein
MFVCIDSRDLAYRAHSVYLPDGRSGFSACTENRRKTPAEYDSRRFLAPAAR